MPIRCTDCGKFFNTRESGCSYVYVPSTDVSYEESISRCRVCTEKYGKPVSCQTTDPDLTSWVMP